MQRLLTGIVVVLVVLAVAAQLALPPYVAGQVEERLERGGGSADVSLGALPAVTLLGGRGSSLEARGSGLAFDLNDREERPFELLDGFAEVDVVLDRIDAGVLAVERFELRRQGRDADYSLTVRATTTPRELAREIGSAAGGALGGLFGSLAMGILPGGGAVAVPLELVATVRSVAGRPEVAAASGSVAGVPAGPLTELVVGAVLGRL
jgi:hypothetical protein